MRSAPTPDRRDHPTPADEKEISFSDHYIRKCMHPTSFHSVSRESMKNKLNSIVNQRHDESDHTKNAPQWVKAPSYGIWSPNLTVNEDPETNTGDTDCYRRITINSDDVIAAEADIRKHKCRLRDDTGYSVYDKRTRDQESRQPRVMPLFIGHISHSGMIIPATVYDYWQFGTTILTTDHIAQ